jgi:hypothetical protein
MSEFLKKIAKKMQIGENNAKVKEIQPQSSSIWMKMSVESIYVDGIYIGGFKMREFI